MKLTIPQHVKSFNLESYQHQIYLLFPLSLQRAIKFDLASPFHSFRSDQIHISY